MDLRGKNICHISAIYAKAEIHFFLQMRLRLSITAALDPPRCRKAMEKIWKKRSPDPGPSLRKNRIRLRIRPLLGMQKNPQYTWSTWWLKQQIILRESMLFFRWISIYYLGVGPESGSSPMYHTSVLHKVNLLGYEWVGDPRFIGSIFNASIGIWNIYNNKSDKLVAVGTI